MFGIFSTPFIQGCSVEPNFWFQSWASGWDFCSQKGLMKTIRLYLIFARPMYPSLSWDCVHGPCTFFVESWFVHIRFCFFISWYCFLLHPDLSSCYVFESWFALMWLFDVSSFVLMCFYLYPDLSQCGFLLYPDLALLFCLL